MAVRLIFPTTLFHRNMIQEGLCPTRGFKPDYLNMLQEEMDAMRRRDPVGRQLSNQYTGWQSHDGVEKNPIFTKCINRIITFFNDEVLPYYGLDPTKAKLCITNSWSNINDKGAWNAPHLHNGCWFSGVFYIQADGDEGQIQMIETESKVVADFPQSERLQTSVGFEPIGGECILFPSGAMHMVEPNQTDKERYSISFNVGMDYLEKDANIGKVENYHRDEYLFELDDKGNPITK